MIHTTIVVVVVMVNISIVSSSTSATRVREVTAKKKSWRTYKDVHTRHEAENFT